MASLMWAVLGLTGFALLLLGGWAAGSAVLNRDTASYPDITDALHEQLCRRADTVHTDLEATL